MKKEFLELLKRAIGVALLKKFVQYMKSLSGEPLYWVILGIIIGLVILGIIGLIQERREKKSEQRHTPKGTEGYSDKKVICHYCKGYGELVTKNKGQKENTICLHCSGTGWIVGR